MVDATTAPPPQEAAKAADCAPCSDACSTLGLGGVTHTVTSVVAGVWKQVSHTAFLGCVPLRLAVVGGGCGGVSLHSTPRL